MIFIYFNYLFNVIKYLASKFLLLIYGALKGRNIQDVDKARLKSQFFKSLKHNQTITVSILLNYPKDKLRS